MKLFLYVCVFLCLYSCSKSNHIFEELNRMEKIINDYPDSALRSSQSIAPGSIRKKSTKARYGLLYALALDKTGQIINNNSMFRPALTYFLRKGTNRQKFLSWYCLGRIEHSANNYQEATESYLKALEYQSLIDDPYLIRACNFMIGELNMQQNNYQRALSIITKPLKTIRQPIKRNTKSAPKLLLPFTTWRIKLKMRYGIIVKH